MGQKIGKANLIELVQPFICRKFIINIFLFTIQK